MTWQIALMISSSVAAVITFFQFALMERKIAELREKLDHIEGRTRLDVSREPPPRRTAYEEACDEPIPVAELIDYRGRAVSPIPYEPPKLTRKKASEVVGGEFPREFTDQDYRHREELARFISPLSPPPEPPLRGKH